MNGFLHIGGTVVPIASNHNAAAMVPDVLFYNNQLVRKISCSTIKVILNNSSMYLVTKSLFFPCFLSINIYFFQNIPKT